MKYHACRWHARRHYPCGIFGILPASEAARKKIALVRSKSKCIGMAVRTQRENGFGTVPKKTQCRNQRG
jgi:hypothetical protein